jgi:hypothetical protein
MLIWTSTENARKWNKKVSYVNFDKTRLRDRPRNRWKDEEWKNSG